MIDGICFFFIVLLVFVSIECYKFFCFVDIGVVVIVIKVYVGNEYLYSVYFNFKSVCFWNYYFGGWIFFENFIVKFF